MQKKLLIFLSLFFLSLTTFAADTTGVPKDEWLKHFKPLAPPAMCQSIFDRESTKRIMNNHNISYDQCITLITTSVDRCLTQISPSLPALITNDEAKKWGREIGVCSGKDFYMNNIAKKS